MRMLGRLGRPPPEVDAPASRSGYGMLLRPMVLPPISPRFANQAPVPGQACLPVGIAHVPPKDRLGGLLDFAGAA